MSFSDSDQPDLLNRGSVANKSIEDLNLELQEQQERLLELKRQQEEVERRKRELEELNKRRSELASGQKLLRERLTRAITVLERSEYEARKEIEQLQITRETFTEHLAQIEAINPAGWTPEVMDEELTKALSKVDHAQSSYNQSRAKIDALSGRDIDDGSSTVDNDSDGDSSGVEGNVPFTELVVRGFALTLPLILVLLGIGLLIIVKF
jgi:molecular chaperone GrpE (heat shock protein)